MSMNNLSADGEFRYVVQWFNEWSEFQRDDFIPVFVEYLKACERPDAATDTAHSDSAATVYMNGIVDVVANSLCISDKPMSLFQCRIKLFREWSSKWPGDFKSKLQQKIAEIDPEVGERIMAELRSGSGCHLNGDEVTVEASIAPVAAGGSATLTIIEASVDATRVTAVPAVPEDALKTIDESLEAALGHETAVDDVDGAVVDGNNVSIHVCGDDGEKRHEQQQQQQQWEEWEEEQPVEQVGMQTQESATTTTVTVTTIPQTISNNELPLVA